MVILLTIETWKRVDELHYSLYGLALEGVER